MSETPKSKSGWRIIRRILIALAVIATLIAIFYTEEDWRGKRAWEKCKAELEAQGAVLDWDKFIPPSVPNDQNFFTFSTNFLVLKQISTNEIETVKKISWLKGLSYQKAFPIFDTSSNGPIVIASIIISSEPGRLEPGSNTLVVALNDPNAAARVQQAIQATMGQTTYGAMGFEFTQFQLTNLQPAKITITTDTLPSAADLMAFVPSDKIGQTGRLKLAKTVSPNIFQIQLTGVRITSATDYLAWSDQFVPGFNDIREALKRPYAILPGDYSEPYQVPIPNFVMLRVLAQTLAQRAQCYLLLGEPEQALHELTLIHDVCRILEKPPTGQPETLIEAMIKVAITGLYAEIISEGFQRHAWQEPQLITFQQQLAQINLPVCVARSFKSEQASTTHTLETMPIAKLMALSTPDETEWQKIKNLKYSLMPRGWVYQNMAIIAPLGNLWRLGSFDAENETISPTKIADCTRAIRKVTGHPSVCTFMVDIAFPNFTKAWQTTAYYQTMANEAQIACALERFRLAYGEYPNSLDSLAPQFLETLPHDIIGGQPLHYHETNDGTFLLYSIGWNEIDDGGEDSPHNQYGGITDYTRGDWVWTGTGK